MFYIQSIINTYPWRKIRMSTQGYHPIIQWDSRLSVIKSSKFRFDIFDAEKKEERH